MQRAWGFFIWLVRIILVAVSVVGLAGIVTDTLQAKVFLGLSWYELAFVIFIIAAWIVLCQLIYKLNKIEGAKPKIAFKGTENVTAPLRNIQTGQVFGTPTFTHAIFANDPKVSTKSATAEKVLGHVSFYTSDRKTMLFEMVGRWAETPERAMVGPKVVDTNQIDMAPNAMPRTLDIVMKYAQDDDCYGLNNDNPARSPMDWRDKTRKLSIGEYAIKVRIRGTNVDDLFWFILKNPGAGSEVILTPAKK